MHSDPCLVQTVMIPKKCMEYVYQNHFLYVETHPTWEPWQTQTRPDQNAIEGKFEMTGSTMEEIRFFFKFDTPTLYNMTIWLDPDLEFSGNPTCEELQLLTEESWHADRLRVAKPVRQPDSTLQ